MEKGLKLNAIITVLVVVGMLCMVACTTTYTVSFDSNGSSQKYNSQPVAANGLVKEPSPDPARDGYIFTGWYTGKVCTEANKWNFETPVTSDMTLYAGWDKAAKPQKWCVMAYRDFSNLMEFGLDNLDEICQSTSNENVKVYILTGGAKTVGDISEYTYLSEAIQPLQPGNPFAPSAKADTYQFWEYTSEGKLVELTSPVKGMNDPDVLFQFIEQCYKKAKSSDPDAEFRYILEMWDHGNGSYVGLIDDCAIPAPQHTFEEGKTMMSLADCGNAIKTVTSKNGFKFEAVVLDMCLMQSIETAHTISSAAANYIIGSQTSAASLGSAYKDWFNFLYQNPNATGYEFGKYFCDAAYVKIERSKSELSDLYIKNITWSVLDMSKLDALEEAYEAYSASELSKVEASAVEKYIDNINKMPAFDPETQVWGQYMYDINVFTNQVGSASARSALMTAIERAIAYKKYGETQENAGCCGLSMCILTDTNGWNTDWSFSDAKNTAYLEKCLTPNYRKFQRRIASDL